MNPVPHLYIINGFFKYKKNCKEILNFVSSVVDNSLDAVTCGLFCIHCSKEKNSDYIDVGNQRFHCERKEILTWNGWKCWIWTVAISVNSWFKYTHTYEYIHTYKHIHLHLYVYFLLLSTNGFRRMTSH